MWADPVEIIDWVFQIFVVDIDQFLVILVLKQAQIISVHHICLKLIDTDVLNSPGLLHDYFLLMLHAQRVIEIIF